MFKNNQGEKEWMLVNSVLKLMTRGKLQGFRDRPPNALKGVPCVDIASVKLDDKDRLMVFRTGSDTAAVSWDGCF